MWGTGWHGGSIFTVVLVYSCEIVLVTQRIFVAHPRCVELYATYWGHVDSYVSHGLPSVTINSRRCVRGFRVGSVLGEFTIRTVGWETWECWWLKTRWLRDLERLRHCEFHVLDHPSKRSLESPRKQKPKCLRQLLDQYLVQYILHISKYAW